MLPATVLLGAQVNIISLAEPNGCRTKPGSSAPPGTHWLYRVNPLDNQRCWFLSDKGVKAQLRARDGTSPPVPARPTRPCLQCKVIPTLAISDSASPRVGITCWPAVKIHARRAPSDR